MSSGDRIIVLSPRPKSLLHRAQGAGQDLDENFSSPRFRHGFGSELDPARCCEDGNSVGIHGVALAFNFDSIHCVTGHARGRTKSAGAVLELGLERRSCELMQELVVILDQVTKIARVLLDAFDAESVRSGIQSQETQYSVLLRC